MLLFVPPSFKTHVILVLSVIYTQYCDPQQLGGGALVKPEIKNAITTKFIQLVTYCLCQRFETFPRQKHVCLCDDVSGPVGPCCP